MMKRTIVSLLFLALGSYMAWGQSGILEKLQQIKEISDIKKMDIDSFDEYYEFWYEQPIDHSRPEGGKFKQRVLLGHKNKPQAPVIVELQGYNIWSPKAGELAQLLNGNQLTIEHRFFDRSVPQGGIPWEYLTIKQAATDQHEIIQAIRKNIYPEVKWVSTGISKGGQTTIFHRYFYPEDVDVSVPYVAPLNLKYVDPRLAKFLEKAGTSKVGFGKFLFGNDERNTCHWDIKDFQNLCFQKIDSLIPMVEEYAQEKNYTFETVGGIRRAVQLMILEYPFAFWQWGHKCSNIPLAEDGIEAIYTNLMEVSGPSFFEDKNIVQQQPFFYAALTEIGMYDYKVKPFKKYLPDKEDITFVFTMPKGIEQKPFNEQQMKDINRWLQTDAEKMLFIYGGMDPWGATAVDLKENSKCRKYVKADMDHTCRIKHFEEITRQDIIETLKSWLK